MPTIPFSTIIDKECIRPPPPPNAARFMDEEDKKMDAAVQLMLAREEAHLSQEELAKRSGVSRATVNRIERGRIMPLLNTLEKLAKAMGKTVKISLA
ncbi:helix-turn-helix domain-containing protein [Bifidobacterium gallicum]|uniref:helix-turn-helix domain-containing protein n=1 Tax=Bifidobacterium gallicum TaxID=78342 RepID=UPI0005C6FCE9|nr:helix-turn-helix transcriptional regulator [Bifidobacterium gallicum]